MNCKLLVINCLCVRNALVLETFKVFITLVAALLTFHVQHSRLSTTKTTFTILIISALIFLLTVWKKTLAKYKILLTFYLDRILCLKISFLRQVTSFSYASGRAAAEEIRNRVFDQDEELAKTTSRQPEARIINIRSSPPPIFAYIYIS